MLEAVESSVNGTFTQLQSCGGDSSEEELSVLPRHTKVVVTGNNRTKSVLVGLQGFVKKAVGLGGWHWLVLTNGIEVKLQRNALSVIEAPTGNEEDDDLEFENLQWNGSDMGDFLELRDLDKHGSPSSSSESSSFLTRSSDECFDSLALLQDLDSEINQDLVQKDAGYKFRVSKPNEVVMTPAISVSRISSSRSESPTEEILKTDCSVPGSAMGNRNLDKKVLKHVVRSQKADYRDEGPSSDHHNLATSSRGHKAAPDGEKKAAVGRMKKLKKYFCFMLF